MKKFDVYQHPVKGYQAVKEGFSWPGFLFGTIWCFVKGLFWWGFGLMAVAIALNLLIDNDLLLMLTSIGMSMAIGSEGNGWRRDRLVRLGYRHLGQFGAGSSESAVAAAVGTSPLTVQRQPEPVKAVS